MGTIQIDGSTPKLTIGNATAEDATILFDGNAQDFYIALDDSADDLLIGLGSTVGTTPIIAIDENKLSTFSGAITVGVDDTGHDVKLFGASAGAYALWDESANLLDLRGATAAGPGNLKLTTGELTVVDADVLGKIEFQAPLESSGTDAILVGASIYAEADDTFAAGVNNTDLVFALGKSEAAAEKFRFTADTEIGIGGANYGTDGQVLTSGGAGAAVAWEDASGAVTALNNATENELVTVGNTTTELDAEPYASVPATGKILAGDASYTGDWGQAYIQGQDGDETICKLVGGEDSSGYLNISSDQLEQGGGFRIYVPTDQLLYIGHRIGHPNWDDEIKISNNVCTTEHAWTTASVDYAEFFEWKVQLANEDAVKANYGLTVVLDGDKVRLAEIGEESDVIGVVRPSFTSAFVGGDGMNWKGKYLKNVWGENEEEPYTELEWRHIRENGELYGKEVVMADRIPTYQLKENPEDTHKPGWHLLEKNFKRDESGNFIPIVIPSTDEEKAASKYVERTTNKYTNKPLMRKIYNPSFDAEQEYISRHERRTEHCLVGLLGQVPIRDTAIIPTHWKKMKNLESGIDQYFIK